VIRLLVAGAGLRSLSEFRSSLRAERQTMLGKEGMFPQNGNIPFPRRSNGRVTPRITQACIYSMGQNSNGRGVFPCPKRTKR